jgi:hypothetical protein
MSEAIIWIHGDCLHPAQMALRRHPDIPALFVWDDDLLRRRQIAFKRILFIYECLLDLPVAIRRGQVAQEIFAFAEEHKTRMVITTGSVSPGFERICRRLREQRLEVIIYDEEPFVDLPREPDLRRFSRYWREIRRRLEGFS